MTRHALFSALLVLLPGAVGCGSSSASPGAASADGRDAADEVVDGNAGAGAGDGATEASPAADAGAPAPDGGSPGDAGALADGGLAGPTGRPFPDTTASIAVLTDQLPSMNQAQMAFATSHYVGTEKQLVAVTQALRALNPNFLVLHYHLSMWQSAEATTFILPDASCSAGMPVCWANDYSTVNTHEDWFWHNAASERVTSTADQKLLMNVSVAGFQQYWEQSLEDQVTAGEYDGIFFDSASPALLQAECGGNGTGQDPRLAGTSAKSTVFAELGNATWIAAWQVWMKKLNDDLAAKGIPLIPNTSAFTTTWDTTDYGLTTGIFDEGFAGTSFAMADWTASTNELLKLAAADKIMILQNYLTSADDVATRMYYLGNYLLVKGRHTYVEYFASGPLEWYPEWKVDLGAPSSGPAADVSSLLAGGVYRRDFAKGSVLVNPGASMVTVALGGTYQRVVPSGGGAVDGTGTEPGTLSMQPVTSIQVQAASAEIVLK
ncbi:MAG TPA: putative glycoside hydrolase [Polyangiaceae bacterium]|jgi:hypothetical protein|nr:putative glycoside hydrolase [Polyangiaceae bacterium]